MRLSVSSWFLYMKRKIVHSHLCVLFLLSSCSYFSLENIDMQVELIEGHWEQEADGRYRAPDCGEFVFSFNAPLRKQAFSSIAKIYCNGEIVDCLAYWEDDFFHIAPIESWEAGKNYLLYVRGFLQAEDGREEYVEYGLSFYYRRQEAFRLLQASPAHGQLVEDGQEACLWLRFSHPVHEGDLKEALSIARFGEYRLESQTDGQDFFIYPEPGKSLMPGSYVHWSLQKSLTDKEGAALACPVEKFFILWNGQELPQLHRKFILEKNDSEYVEVTEFNKDLYPWQVLGLEFSRAMDKKSLSENIQLSPGSGLEIIFLDESRIAILPKLALNFSENYLLTVGQGVRDIDGLHLPADIHIDINILAPYLEIIELELNGKAGQRQNISQWSFVSTGDGPSLWHIHFSHEIDRAALTQLYRLLRCKTIYPQGLAAPRIVSMRPLSQAWVEVELELPALTAEPYWYSLNIGSKNGALQSGGYTTQSDYTGFVEVRP